MNTTRLDTLLISEISGVDDPANQLPGWMVTKARGGGQPTVLDVIKSAMRTSASEEVEVVKAGPRPSYRERVIESADRLRKAVGNDDIFTALIRDEALIFEGRSGTVVLAKARHDARHAATGRFRTTATDAAPSPPPAADFSLAGWRHSGAVHDTLRRGHLAARGKGAPADTGERSDTTPYTDGPIPNPGGDGTL